MWQSSWQVLKLMENRVDELVYLSPGKLNQFVSGPGKLPLRPSSFALKLPFVELSVGFENREADVIGPMLKKLDRVRDRLLMSGRSPHWFEEHDVEAGDWVQLEAALSCSTVRIADHEMVVFVQPAREVRDAALLLHGSPRSLRPQKSGGSDIDVSDASSADGMSRLLTNMALELPDHEVSWPARGAELLLSECRSRALGYPYTEGWAKVTAVLTCEGERDRCSAPPRIVVASPLYLRNFERCDEYSGDA